MALVPYVINASLAGLTLFDAFNTHNFTELLIGISWVFFMGWNTGSFFKEDEILGALQNAFQFMEDKDNKEDK